MIPAFLLGAVSWTFAEYALHDWVFHGLKGRIESSREHLKHHRVEGYFASNWLKLKFGIVLLGPMFVASALVVGGPGFAFTAGFGLAYAFYEALHYRIHTAAPLNRYGLWARRHHLHHHHRDATRNHGVTSPVWDVVFRTRDQADVVRIPRKRAPVWLVDPSGEVRPEYATSFVLVGPR